MAVIVMVLIFNFYLLRYSDAGSNRIEDVSYVVVDFATLEYIEHISTMESAKKFEELGFEGIDLLQWDVTKESMSTTIEDGNLFLDWHRVVLLLDEQTGILSTLIDGECCNWVHVTTKFGE